MKAGRLLLRLLQTRRALRLERRYSRSLEEQLEGERWRNQSREDQLMTVPMRVAGLFGIEERTGPAKPMTPLRRRIEQPRRPVAQSNPWAALTDDERAEWPIYFADADPSGEREHAVRKEFLEMIAFRRQQNDGDIM